MKKVTQKALSLLLSLAMLFGMVQGAAVPAFAEIASSVSIGVVTVADSNWYAKTDTNGAVTKCKGMEDWNVHVVKDSGTPSTPATATVTLKNATIANPSYSAPAISTAGYNLNIVLEGTANQIGTGAESSNGYAIYSSTANDIKITGEGDLTLKGYYGINVNGSGNVKIDTTGILSITSKWQMICASGSLTVSAKSITANGYYFQSGGATSLTATDGNIGITGSSDDAVQTSSGSVTVAAPKGAVSLSGNRYAIYTGSDGNEVKVSAKNNITMTGTVKGGPVSVASETGNVTVNSYYAAIEGAKTSVAVTAPQGDVTLTSGNTSNIISGGSGYTLAVTAHGKLDAKGGYGIVSYTSAAIKADTVRVASTDVGYGFDGGALTITNPEGGNCSEVSVSGGGKSRDAIQSSGDVTVKANQVVIAANIDADPYYGTKAIDATGNVTIGDAGVIVGNVSIQGTKDIAPGVVLVSQNGGDASTGLDLKTSTPAQSTYYKAGDGFAFFIPKSDEAPSAKLILHNAAINNTTKYSTTFGSELDGIALPAEDVTVQAEGTNIISSYDGNGISGTNLTLSGDGTLTVEKTKCGISISNGSFAFADGAKVTLNSTVTAGDISHIVSTVYGNVTVASTDIYNKMRLSGAVTIAKDATLTVPKGQELFLNDTISITINGKIVNNGTVYLPYNYTVEKIQALNLSGSILLFDSANLKYKAYVNGAIYAYGGKKPGGFSFSNPLPAEPTCYYTNSGYFIFTPEKDGTRAVLTLHNVVFRFDSLTLPNTPVTLRLEGKNEIYTTDASAAVTVDGSGTLNARLFRNDDYADKLTVTGGATLNALYQTKENSSITTNTIYGSHAANDYQGIVAQGGEYPYKLVLTPGAVLTLENDGYLTVGDFSYLTIGAGASIVNNTYVTLPKGTAAAKIKDLPLSGSGVVRILTNDAGDQYDTYANDGTPLKTIADGGLDLTDTEVPASENKGYTWTKSGEGGSEVWTLTLNNTCIEGDVTLPGKTIVINTAAKSVFRGTINTDYGFPISLTFTGSAPLNLNGIGGGYTNDNVTVRDGAQVTVNGEISLGSGDGGTLNVTGLGTKLTVSGSDSNQFAVECGIVNVGSGACLTADMKPADTEATVGVKALTGVNVTGGSTLTTSGNYGVYMEGGKLAIDKSSKLITTASTASFCAADTTKTKPQGEVLALPGVPDGTEIASVTGKIGKYWSLVPAKGSLSISDEIHIPVTLTGAAANSTLNFVKPAATVSDVTVSPSAVSVQKGNSQTFSAVVTGNNEPSQTVIWSVSGNQSQNTAIDGNGKLTVAANETASTVSVKATSTDNIAKYGTAVVTVTGSGNPSNPSNPDKPGNSGGSGSGSSASSSTPSLPSIVTANPANGNAAGTVTVNATADISGASFPSGVTSVTFSVTPETSAGVSQGVPGGTADTQGAAAYRLAVLNPSLNMIGSPSLYNLKLLDQSGNPITGFTGTVRVRIPLPAGLRGTPRVFRYESVRTFTDMKAAVENGFLVFSTDHFSYYVIAGTGDSITLDTKNYQMPVNASYQIGVKLTGSKAAPVKFRSTNEKSATVTKLANGNYQVTGKKPGTVYIMFDVYDNKNKLLTHASVRVDVKTGIRPRGDSTRQIGVY